MGSHRIGNKSRCFASNFLNRSIPSLVTSLRAGHIGQLTHTLSSISIRVLHYSFFARPRPSSVDSWYPMGNDLRYLSSDGLRSPPICVVFPAH
ncbi:hypothetical protein BYT27DRAFT_7192105 [Phlegmacium glaucopus]|nr:hypothetical protein BYT27DRAFT_7192105 [Phlegmacium glaucopus]